MPVAKESDFQFIDYRLPKLHFSGLENKSVEGEFELSIQFSTHTIEVDRDQASASLETWKKSFEFEQFNVVTLSFWVEWEPSPGPFEFESVIEGLFARTPEMTEEHFRDFSEILAPSILFSHARPVVNLLMMEAKESFRLPLLNISQVIRESRQQDQKA